MSVTFAEAKEALEQRVGEAALRHCEGVAETAAQLAAIYGIDPEQARVAGLLHDWDRELEDGDLLGAARRAGVELGPTDVEVPYLLHARTGAKHVEQTFPLIDHEVVRAIERHTLGHPEMSELDMVVFIADMIEPGRRFPGVADLREAAGVVSLGDLFALAYQRSVEHLVKARKRIHPLTVAVWNALVAREQR